MTHNPFLEKEPEKAIPYLLRSRELSESKQWSAKDLIKSNKHGNLFSEASDILCDIYIDRAKSLHLTYPQEAIQICKLARKYAVNGKLHFEGFLFLIFDLFFDVIN